MAGYSGDVALLHKVKHNLVCDEIASLKLSPKNQNLEDGKPTFDQTTMSRSPKLGGERENVCKTTKSLFLSIYFVSFSQTNNQVGLLESKYAPHMLYLVIESRSSGDFLEIDVRKDDIVAVIKHQDPMGNEERWFVDTGGK
jgi:hypothetical protein